MAETGQRLIEATFTAPTGTKCTIYFKTAKEGNQFSKWLADTLEAAAEKGKQVMDDKLKAVKEVAPYILSVFDDLKYEGTWPHADMKIEKKAIKTLKEILEIDT